MTAARPALGQATAADLAVAAVAGVLADLSGLDSRGQRGVVVDSPPGAGKSALVVRAAAELARVGEPVMVVEPVRSSVPLRRPTGAAASRSSSTPSTASPPAPSSRRSVM